MKKAGANAPALKFPPISRKAGKTAIDLSIAGLKRGSEAEAAEALVELGNAATAVHELLVAAGPGRM